MQISRIRLSDKTSRLLSRVTPSAVSEPSSELIGCPISRSLATRCVSLELRSLPSTGTYPASAVLRTSPPPQGARPVRHRRPVGRPRPRPGASRVARAFLVYMLSPLPRRSGREHCCAHISRPCQPSPIGSSGRPAHRPFRGLLGVHSRCGLHTRAVTVFRDTLSEGFSHFVSSIAAPVASGWSRCRAGFSPTGKRRLCTAHTRSGHSLGPL